MIDFKRVTGAIADMDGVLWRGDTPLAGLHDLFAFWRAHAIPFALATNNSRMTPADYVIKLAKMGINGIDERQIVTSGTATAAYVTRQYPYRSVIHVLGGDGLRAVLIDAGFEVTSEIDPRVVAVAVGMDFALTYDKLKNASLCLRAGADFIATNTDATFPTPQGLVPGAGSIIAALQTASGRTPISMGKPGRAMFDAALDAIGITAESALMLGDRLDTDIAGAAEAGLQTALVLTGVTSAAELERSTVQPDGVYSGLPALIAAWG